MSTRLSVLKSFVENECIPSEVVFAREMEEIEARTGSRWTEIPPVLCKLKVKARARGLWNLFMPKVGGHTYRAQLYFAMLATVCGIYFIISFVIRLGIFRGARSGLEFWNKLLPHTLAYVL